MRHTPPPNTLSSPSSPMRHTRFPSSPSKLFYLVIRISGRHPEPPVMENTIPNKPSLTLSLTPKAHELLLAVFS